MPQPKVSLDELAQIEVSDDIEIIVRRATLPDTDLLDVRVRHIPSDRFGGGLTVPSEVLPALVDALKDAI